MDKRRFPTHASDLGGCSHLKIVDKKPNDLFFFFAFKAKPIVRSPEGQETSWPVCAVTKIPSFLEPSQWGWGESGQRGRKSPFQSQEKWKVNTYRRVGVGQVENSYVSDLLRTQEGVLGGRWAQLYTMSCKGFVWSAGDGFTQDGGGRPRRLLVLSGWVGAVLRECPIEERRPVWSQSRCTNVSFPFQIKLLTTACSPHFSLVTIYKWCHLNYASYLGKHV